MGNSSSPIYDESRTLCQTGSTEVFFYIYTGNLLTYHLHHLLPLLFCHDLKREYLRTELFALKVPNSIYDGEQTGSQTEYSFPYIESHLEIERYCFKSIQGYTMREDDGGTHSFADID